MHQTMITHCGCFHYPTFDEDGCGAKAKTRRWLPPRFLMSFFDFFFPWIFLHIFGFDFIFELQNYLLQCIILATIFEGPISIILLSSLFWRLFSNLSIFMPFTSPYLPLQLSIASIFNPNSLCHSKFQAPLPLWSLLPQFSSTLYQSDHCQYHSQSSLPLPSQLMPMPSPSNTLMIAATNSKHFIPLQLLWLPRRCI